LHALASSTKKLLDEQHKIKKRSVGRGLSGWKFSPKYSINAHFGKDLKDYNTTNKMTPGIL
jgi:hypothetical protein